MLAAAADDSLFDSNAFDVAKNLGIFLLVVFWLATVYWVYKDARRRIEDPWLVAMATLLGAIPPFLGPLIYMLFRPPEYIEDVRERELEILAIEERLAERDLRCPVCRGVVEPSFLVCPVCTTRLKQSCGECAAPLEPIWQVCPYCATAVPPGIVTGEDVLQPVRPRRSAPRLTPERRARLDQMPGAACRPRPSQPLRSRRMAVETTLVLVKPDGVRRAPVRRGRSRASSAAATSSRGVRLLQASRRRSRVSTTPSTRASRSSASSSTSSPPARCSRSPFAARTRSPAFAR